MQSGRWCTALKLDPVYRRLRVLAVSDLPKYEYIADYMRTYNQDNHSAIRVDRGPFDSPSANCRHPCDTQCHLVGTQKMSFTRSGSTAGKIKYGGPVDLVRCAVGDNGR